MLLNNARNFRFNMYSKNLGMFYSTGMVSCNRFKDKTVIVTASTDGVGFALAERFLLEGANVVISSRKQENVNSALKTLESSHTLDDRLLAEVCHVGKQEHRTNLIQKTVAKFGKIDVLISNAAVNPYFGPIMKTSEEQWDKIFSLNVRNAFQLSQECFPYLKKTNGNIVFVSSIAGYAPFPGLGAYSVSKTALIGLTKAMAQEISSGEEKVRVNCLAPGVVKTKFSEALWKNENNRKQFENIIAMKDFAEPQDMAGTVAFLASNDARYITGETICTTGGMTGRL